MRSSAVLVALVFAACAAWISAAQQGSAAGPPGSSPAPAARETVEDAPHASEWLTDGGDNARSGWQRSETRLSPATVTRMQLLWTRRVDNAPRQMHALLAPLVLSSVMIHGRARSIVVLAGVSDNLFGIDAGTGALLWSLHFDSVFRPAAGGRGYGALCPGGQTATPAAVRAEGGSGYLVYAVSWDGRLSTVDPADGHEAAPAAPFVPPDAKAYALNVFDGVVYTTTGQGCGGRANALYAFDLATRGTAQFSPSRGGMWGRRGVSIGGDGTIYVGSGDAPFDPARGSIGQSIVAIARDRGTRALRLKDYYAPENAAWMTLHDLDMNVTGPVFQFRGHEVIVQSSKECRLWLLDTAALGGADHRTPLDRTPLVCNEGASFESAGVWGAMSTWEDPAGERWVFAPVWGALARGFEAPVVHGRVEHGAIAAFRVEQSAGGPRLAPAWVSRDMNRAEPPIVANGVVFAYGSGESTTQRWSDPRHADGTVGRIADSTHAVLYALDARTGEELWTSGSQIRSWNHASGLAVADGRVYIGTYDGTLYCFGLRGEQRR
jgi:outer membrane protein assembly factor BamB